MVDSFAAAVLSVWPQNTPSEQKEIHKGNLSLPVLSLSYGHMTLKNIETAEWLCQEFLNLWPHQNEKRKERKDIV